MELLKTFQSTHTEPGKLQNTASVPEEDAPPAGPRARASRLEFKTVDERYIPHTRTHDQADTAAAGTKKQASTRL